MLSSGSVHGLGQKTQQCPCNGGTSLSITHLRLTSLFIVLDGVNIHT